MVVDTEIVKSLLALGWANVRKSKEHRKTLIDFYSSVGKPIQKHHCGSCMSKAFFSLSNYLNTNNYKMSKYSFVDKDTKYRDRFSDSMIITSHNLTDEIAERMISRNPALISLFNVAEIEEKPQVKRKTRKKKTVSKDTE